MEIDYTKICFVIMPFGKKKVDEVEIDFDHIYQEIFEPAIKVVDLPEGGKLIPKRTDQDYFSANIDTEMFRYLEYSRFAFVDITGLNANVFYELGIRHHAHQSGTAIFRQSDMMPPFDISHIKAFPYEFEPNDKLEESKELITKVLTASLKYNRIDSPIQVALDQQKAQGGHLEAILEKIPNALRNDDVNGAIQHYKKAIQLDNGNPKLHIEIGLLLKQQGKWPDACSAFLKSTELSPQYGEAWRELGIAQNKVSGEEALLKSIELNTEDFDAYASLGGIKKRAGKFEEAQELYKKSVKASNGHPYPLMNYVVLLVRDAGIDAISAKLELYMKRAEPPLRKQVDDDPPYNAPWSFFDLSTIRLFLGDKKEAEDILKKGIASGTAPDWALQTHFDTLNLIDTDQVEGLAELKQVLTDILDDDL